ncbi:MAG: hypothetical protein GY757_08390 [bacterium]|nr:hypothetical protein [bacterium]
MKIENVHLKGHPLFDELKIDFTGSDGKPLDIIVVAGLNGSGKTSLLKAIFEIMSDQDFEFEPLSSVELKIQSYAPGFENDKFNVYHRDAVTPYTVWRDKFKSVDEKIRPKLIYMPTEINFEKLSVKTLSFTSAYSFVNVVNQKMIEDIPSFIASEISSEVFKNPELPKPGIDGEMIHQGAIDYWENEVDSLKKDPDALNEFSF